MNELLLSLIAFLPLLGMGVILLLPGSRLELIRTVAVITAGIVFVLTILLWYGFSHSTSPGVYGNYDAATYIEHAWIPAYHIYFRFGVDGLSVMLIVLTGLLSFLATFTAFSVKKQVKAFYALYLVLLTGMMGVFMALDFFLFYVFWELMLLPMYFLIGVWGGERRAYAAIKFFIYTLAGSVLILLVMIAFYSKMNSMGLAQYAFNIPELVARKPFGADLTLLPHLLFWGLFIGFAIKVPIFPFHTWLPDAHVEAPTAISVILAGVLLKMGGYGILRLNYPLLPDVARSSSVMYFLAVLGVVNIIYGAFCALGQTDFKRLVAYSSVSHMGYVLLGIAVLKTEAVNGAIFQMFAHGISSGMMFMLVGVVYERAHHREIARFGGLASQMPNYFALAMIGFFASLGLPSMVGFIGEVMVFLGAFAYSKVLAAIATVGMLLTAGYILWTMQRVFLGEAKEKHGPYPDCSWVELTALTPLAAVAIFFGIFPAYILNIYTASTDIFMRYF